MSNLIGYYNVGRGRMPIPNLPYYCSDLATTDLASVKCSTLLQCSCCLQKKLHIAN